jgi:hypothetical protein
VKQREEQRVEVLREATGCEAEGRTRVEVLRQATGCEAEGRTRDEVLNTHLLL